jgi:DNA-3-methyladenine glycosylase
MKHVGEAISLGRLRRLRRAELHEDTVELARYLIGKIVVHDADEGTLSGRIVETEGLRTLHLRFVVHAKPDSEAAGVGAGVLLPPLEPLEGIDQMQRLHGGAGMLDLARRSGRLARAMRIDFRQDGLDLCAPNPLWLATSRQKTGAIGKSVRIGLTRNVDRKLRFYERANQYVSVGRSQRVIEPST